MTGDSSWTLWTQQSGTLMKAELERSCPLFGVFFFFSGMVMYLSLWLKSPTTQCNITINSPGFSIRPIQGQIPAPLVSKVLLEVGDACSKGPWAGREGTMCRGAEWDVQSARKCPETSSSGEPPTPFLPPGLEKLKGTARAG